MVEAMDIVAECWWHSYPRITRLGLTTGQGERHIERDMGHGRTKRKRGRYWAKQRPELERGTGQKSHRVLQTSNIAEKNQVMAESRLRNCDAD